MSEPLHTVDYDAGTAHPKFDAFLERALSNPEVRAAYEAAQAHPGHPAVDRFGHPIRPIEDTSLLHRWRDRRRCRKGGGHWWHSEDAMIAWFCCQCGKSVDGWPTDGSGR